MIDALRMVITYTETRHRDQAGFLLSKQQGKLWMQPSHLLKVIEH